MFHALEILLGRSELGFSLGHFGRKGIKAFLVVPVAVLQLLLVCIHLLSEDLEVLVVLIVAVGKAVFPLGELLLAGFQLCFGLCHLFLQLGQPLPQSGLLSVQSVKGLRKGGEIF